MLAKREEKIFRTLSIPSLLVSYFDSHLFLYI